MKYTMSMFSDKRDLKDAVMRDAAMTDMEKLENIFAVSKEDLKKYDVQLYYAILAVLDGIKKPNTTSYFER